MIDGNNLFIFLTGIRSLKRLLCKKNRTLAIQHSNILVDQDKFFFPERAQITCSPFSKISKLLGKYFNFANLFFIFKIYINYI